MASSNKLSSLFVALTTVVLSTALLAHGCTPSCSSSTPPPPPPSSGGGGGSCPINALKLEVCANVLSLLKLNIPAGKNNECCPLLEGLVDLDAAVCLCTAIKANVLGINLNVPVDLTLLLNNCGKICPADFTCPA